MNDITLNHNEVTKATLEAMKTYVHPFTSPISRALSHKVGEHHGTGNYYESNDGTYLLTNEHVAREIRTTQLTHKFHNNDNIYKILEQFHYKKAPIDIAATLIPPKIWLHAEHTASAIPQHIFDTRHSPVKGEFLFMAGYSGERAKFGFETLVTPGQPYLTQECEEPNALSDSLYDPAIHFALHYSPEKAVPVKEGARGLPLPGGFSGSLVWNTKRVQSAQSGTAWTPSLARVTGIIWGWPSSAELVATRVEHFRDLIKTPATGMPNYYTLINNET